jgi:hypothetical protein
LTDNWRRVSFKLTENNVDFDHAVNVENEGNSYKIVSREFRSTLNQLKELGAQNIHETRMGIDEIAVYILKENKR